MTVQSLTTATLLAVCKRLFENAVNVDAWLEHGGMEDRLLVRVAYDVTLDPLRRAARYGDGPLVRALVDHFGNEHRRGVTAGGIRAERARPFSLKASRRSGRHKRPPEARAA